MRAYRFLLFDADDTLFGMTFCISSLPELVPLLPKAPRGAAHP